jgi:hypothetical protein
MKMPVDDDEIIRVPRANLIAEFADDPTAQTVNSMMLFAELDARFLDGDDYVMSINQFADAIARNYVRSIH